MENLETKKYTIQKIREEINDGDIKIPDFQRGSIWNKSQIKELLKSLMSGYPIGSILILKNEDSLIIDGLQRILSLLKIQENLFEIMDINMLHNYINNGKQTVNTDDKKIIENILMELRKVEKRIVIGNGNDKKDKLLNEINNLDVTKKISKKLEIMIKRIYGSGDEAYKILAIKLKQTNNDRAIDIFNKINSTGSALSNWDKLAAIWSKNKIKIKLPDRINQKNKTKIGEYNAKTGLTIPSISTKNQKLILISDLIIICFEIALEKTEYFGNILKKNNKIDKPEFLIPFMHMLATVNDKEWKNYEENQIGEILVNKVNKEEIDIDQLVHKLTSSFKFVENSLHRLIKLKANNKKNILIKKNYFSIAMLLALTSTIFYDMTNNQNFKKDSKNYELLKWVIADTIDGYYDTASSKKALEAIKSKKYVNSIENDVFSKKIDALFQKESNNAITFKKKTKFSEICQLLVAIAYSQYTINEDKDLHFDHYIPWNWLKNKHDANKSQINRGISSIGNCAILNEEDNIKKRDNFNITQLIKEENILIGYNEDDKRKLKKLLTNIKNTPKQEQINKLFEWRVRKIKNNVIDFISK